VDAAVVRPLEAGDQSQQRGLAAAGGTEQGEELAVENLQAEVLQHRAAGVGLADRAQGQ
jgi:hypothetical protein